MTLVIYWNLVVKNRIFLLFIFLLELSKDDRSGEEVNVSMWLFLLQIQISPAYCSQGQQNLSEGCARHLLPAVMFLYGNSGSVLSKAKAWKICWYLKE